jgi:hypothetical protein
MPLQHNQSVYTLRDSPFFRLRSRKKLAEVLMISGNSLDRILAEPDLYERRWKHKKDKNSWLNTAPSEEISHLYRPIDIPDGGLKAIQSRIAKLLGRVTPPDWLFSPVKGRSYVDNAARHKGARAFWLLDIADYFPSCTANNVAHLFRAILECSPDVTSILVKLATQGQCLPQGSPCSPILAYYSNVEMWLSISTIVQDAGLIHSLYADDITISGDLIRTELIWSIKGIIHKHGLRIKAEKELSLVDAPADITGVIVKEGRTTLPNRQLKRLFELRAERQRAKGALAKSAFDIQIAGRLAQKRQVEQR